MHASRIRASLLLLSAVACFGLRPSAAAETGATVERVQVADGGSNFQSAPGSAEATLTATTGRVAAIPGHDMSLLSFTAPDPPYLGEIRVATSNANSACGGNDYGTTDNIAAAALMWDPTMTMVHLTFTVPSLCFPGKRLHADITITALRTAELDPEVPGAGMTGGVAHASTTFASYRYGTVSGKIWSDSVGPGQANAQLRTYTGPSTQKSMAVVSDQIIENAYGQTS